MNDKNEETLTATTAMGRRSFINTAAIVGLTAGVAACNDKPATGAAPTAAPVAATKVGADGGVDSSK